jgi:hypothetical protein
MNAKSLLTAKFKQKNCLKRRINMKNLIKNDKKKVTNRVNKMFSHDFKKADSIVATAKIRQKDNIIQ